MLSIYDIAALVLVLSAAFGWLNRRFIHLPHTIGLLVLGLAASLTLVVVNDVAPETGLLEAFTGAVAQIDFFDTMMNGMLAYLLFAGALQIDLGKLRTEAWAVGLMATVGVLISTVMVGAGLWLAARVLGADLPLVWALTFGALISPTDPVAVLALLKTMRVAQIAGGQRRRRKPVQRRGRRCCLHGARQRRGQRRQCQPRPCRGGVPCRGGGGAVLGIVAGYIAVHAMEAIDEYSSKS